VVFLDHIVYVTRDLDETAARMEETNGFRFLPGGRHPGGTSNRVAPLEPPQYLELLAFDVGADALTPEIEVLIDNGRTLLGWGIAVEDIEAVAERLGCEVEAGSITRDDGTTGSWRIVGSDDVWLPFFVAYDDADRRLDEWRDRVREAGNTDFGGFTFVEVGGDPEQLRAWLGNADLPLRFVNGRPGLHAVGIAGPEDEIVIRDDC
jgi:glyoxalase-like protein